jgi:hypothetical protein
MLARRAAAELRDTTAVPEVQRRSFRLLIRWDEQLTVK